MLKVTCKGCGANYKAPDDFAGRKIRCKACSEVMLVGEEADPPSLPASKEDAPQAAASSEKKAPGKKKISFKKGGIKARKGEKKYSFTKGGGSKEAADSKAAESKVYSSGKKSGGKKSPVVLVLALLLVVGGLAALDYFALHMVIGKTPAEKQQENLSKFASELEKNKEALTREFEQLIEEGLGLAPEVTEPGTSAGSEESAPIAGEPAVEPADEAPSLAEIPATSLPLASIVPAEATLILNADVVRLIGAVEGVTGEKFPRELETYFTLPPSGQYSRRQAQQLETIKKVMAAGLDPFSFQRVLVAYSLTTPEAAEERFKEHIEKVKSGASGIELNPEELRADREWAFSLEGRMHSGSMMAIIEGEFSDPASIIAAMVEGGILCGPEHQDPDRRPQVRDGLNIYSFNRAFTGAAPTSHYFTFLSKGQILLADSPMMDKVIALREGEGEALSSNEVFKSMSRSFGRTEALWMVASVPKEAGALLGPGFARPPGGLPGADDEAGAPAPAIKIDSLMLALDSSGTDFSLEFIGATPSPEDAENTQKTIGTQLGGLSLVAMQMLGPKALGLMGKMTPKAEDKNVIISFKLNEKEIVTIREMVEKTFSSFAGPGPVDKGFELPEGLDPSDFETPKAEDAGSVDDEAEAVDPDPEPEEAGKEPEAPTDPEPPADPAEPEEKDGGGEEDPLELDDI